MGIWLDEVFSNSELENRMRSIYQLCRINTNEFVDRFEDFFGVSYEIAFGKQDPKQCIIEMLRAYYPNEYYIKMAFSKQYLKNDNTIYEYPIGESRADVVDVSNSLSCYEIKTKYDNLNRLSKQIEDYSRLFEYVYVVCSEDKFNDVKKIIPKYCGIIKYKNRKNGAFNEVRKAKKSPNIDVRSIIEHFYKKELQYYFNSNDLDHIINKYSKKEIVQLYRKALLERYTN